MAQDTEAVNPPVPEFILPSNLSKMTPEQVELLVANARALRFVRTEQVNKAKKSRQAALTGGTLVKFDKLLERQTKDLEKLDALLEKLEKGSRDIRAAQMMMGEEA